MNERRKALVSKYRAGSIERVGRISLALGNESIETAKLQELKRELHTLKGESTMLGFQAVADIAHASENALEIPDGPERVQAFGAVVQALDVVARSLKEELGEVAEISLAMASDLLRSSIGVVPSPEDEHERERAQPYVTDAADGDEDAAAPAERWVRVAAKRVDLVCERVTEFDATFRGLYHRLHDLARGEADARALRALVSDFDRCRTSLDDITGAAWALRLVPLEPTLADLVGHAREIALSQGKRIRMDVHGGDVQIERTMLDAIGEPLMHLVRNAVDHGIELPEERRDKGDAKLTITGEAAGSNVVLTVTDDGRGIDPARVRAAALERGMLSDNTLGAMSDVEIVDLVFWHGLSTRHDVSDLSGRGVGLDVVRSSVEAIGGTVSIESSVGLGTRFVIRIPSAITKERTLVVAHRDALFGFPSRNVLALVRLADHPPETIAGGHSIRHQDAAIPLRSFGALVGDGGVDERWAVIVEGEHQRWAFAITKPLGDFPLLRRPIDRLVPAMSASATLEDGRLVMILSLAALIRRARHRVERAPSLERDARAMRVLVIDDSVIVRDLMTELLRQAGMEVRAADGGRAALDVLARELPDVVTLDVDMPEMNGFDVLQRIRAHHPELPVIMLTLRASREDQARATALGANAYVVKTQFEESNLVDAIRRVVKAVP